MVVRCHEHVWNCDDRESLIILSLRPYRGFDARRARCDLPWKWGVIFVGDLSWMNVNRAPLDHFLGMMALSARRRAGTFAGAPLNLSVGPVTWESDNSGLGILAGIDVESELWTGRQTLVALELLYFAPASWRGENPTTALPNTTTNDPRLALRLRFGRLLGFGARRH